MAIDKTNTKSSLRQIARSLADEIHYLAEFFSVQGHLATQFSSLLPNADRQHIIYYSYWCADFQIENPNCPISVKQFLGQPDQERAKNLLLLLDPNKELNYN